MRSRLVKNDKMNRNYKNSITQSYNNNQIDSKNDNNYDYDRK